MRRELNRAWRLGRAVRRSVAVRRADREARPAASEALVEELGGLHGLPQKIGQLFSLDELTSETPRYTRLTEAPPVLSKDEAWAQIEAELGGPLDSFFSEIDPVGISASLAQVHRARLLDGREVAVKIRYPSAADDLDVDLKALHLATLPFGKRARGFDVNAYQRELGEMARGELNYLQEAEHLETFGQRLRGWPHIAVPEVIDELCGPRILVMTWLKGHPFHAVRRWPLDDRQVLGESMARLFLSSCLDFGLLHADPHPGNYRFHRDEHGRPRIGVLDFGCCRAISREVAGHLRELLLLIADCGAFAPVGEVLARFVGMGFSEALLEPMAERLPAVAALVFAPLVAEEPFYFGDWDVSARLSELLGEDRWGFRVAGPPSLLYVMRGYRGLTAYLDALDAPVDLRATLFEICGRAPRTAPDLPALQPRLGESARRLLIRVTDGQVTRVQLAFRAAAVENLGELVPEEILPQLAERGIDVEAIAAASLARGIPAEDLFKWEEGGRRVRVWVE